MAGLGDGCGDRHHGAQTKDPSGTKAGEDLRTIGVFCTSVWGFQLPHTRTGYPYMATYYIS